MKTAVHTTLIFSGAVCVVLMALGLIFQQPLLQLIKTPEDVLADSSLYLDIYIWGLPFVFFYNISEGIFSAMGDSKTPFIFLACSSLSNIAMDILFVTAFNMGVRALPGHLPVPGDQLPAGAVLCAAQAGEDPHRGRPRTPVFAPHPGGDRAHRPAKHFAAELYLGGQHRYPKRGQQLWRQRNGRVFGGNQAE